MIYEAGVTKPNYLLIADMGLKQLKKEGAVLIATSLTKENQN